MKAKWVNIVDSLQGNVDQRHYTRRIPGKGEYGAVCAKPELSKKTKRVKNNETTITNNNINNFNSFNLWLKLLHWARLCSA